MKLTLPALAALGLFGFVFLGVCVHHFRQSDHLWSKISAGLVVMLIGYLIIQFVSSSPSRPQLSVSDAIWFRYRDFYQGMVLFETGRALFLAPVLAEILRRLLGRTK